MLSLDDRVEDALAGLNYDRTGWPVMRGQRLAGMFSPAAVYEELAAGRSARPLAEVLAPDAPDPLMSVNYPHVHVDHPFDVALQTHAPEQLDRASGSEPGGRTPPAWRCLLTRHPARAWSQPDERLKVSSIPLEPG
jgi:hypothetical protein